MATPKGIFVPDKEIAHWREKDAALERQISELIQQRSENKARLDAAELLAASMGEREEKDPLEPAKPNGAADDGDSPAFDLVENLRKTGDSLKVKDLRRRLAEVGHGDKAAEKNYIYGLVYRLVKSGKLIKRGPKYRAAPISSPEGETEAVGASARH